MPYLETVEELAEHLADALGIYNSSWPQASSGCSCSRHPALRTTRHTRRVAMDLDTFCAQVVPPTHPAPSTHADAVPLVQAACGLLLGNATDVMVGDLVIAVRAPDTAVVVGSIRIIWHGRYVLIATLAHEVWLYYPGPWEAELHDITLAQAPGHSGASMAQLSKPPSSAEIMRAGQGFAAEKQAIIDESLRIFKAIRRT